MAGTPITKKESELLALYQGTGVDFSELPPIMTAQQLAALLGMTVDALSQDRVRRKPDHSLRKTRAQGPLFCAAI